MIYVKRLLANDIPTGKQFAIPSYIADPFFGVKTENGDWEKTITLNFINEEPAKQEHNGLSATVKLYPYPDRDESRFTVDINNLLRESLNAKVGDILVLIQGRSDSDYSFRLVRQGDSEKFEALSRLFVDAEKAKSRAGGHALLELDFEGQAPSYEKYIKLLKENHNLVLTGAPGTGKTHLAKEIAAQMGAETQFVQFHPSYDYTDFVEGLRPNLKDDGVETDVVTDDGSIEKNRSDDNKEPTFVLKNGVFKNFCKQAILYSTQGGECDDEEDIQVGSFRDILNTIKDDIKRGILDTYSPSGRLSVNSDNRIQYNRTKTKKTIYESNLELLFDYYVKISKYDLSSTTKEELQSVLASLTKGRSRVTRTVDFTEYKWTLQEVLRRKEAINNRSFVRNTTPVNKPFVFIIDEINRGELSKIFGELFYAIDPGYRGEKGRVCTQYQELITDKKDPFKSGFYVPENVYIIGTMNDIDRSVESMDFAVRRRFAWREITSAESADNMGLSEDVKARMKNVNDTIEKCELSPAYHIGGAYFLKLKGDDYESLWENHIKGLVEEYFRGNPDGSEHVKSIHKALVEG